MLAKAAFPALLFTLSAFILLLLVTLSVPIIKNIYLLSITGPSITGNVRLGVFGACYQGGSTQFYGVSWSGAERCTGVTVGYDLDPTYFGNNGRGAVVVAKALSGSLVLNPVAAAFAGFSLIFALLAWCLPGGSGRISEIITFITLIFASLIAWIAFALDIAIALVVRKRVEDFTNDVFDARLGPAVWMALAAAILLTLGVCAAGCGSFGRYSERSRSLNNTSPGMTVVSEKTTRRTWPWQKKTVHQSRGTY